MNEQLQLTDDLLRRALAQRMAYDVPPRLLDRVVSGAAEVAQERAPRWRSLGAVQAGQPARGWAPLPAFAGLAAAVVVALAAILAFRAAVVGPGGTPPPSASPSPTPTAPVAPTVIPEPTPEARQLGEHAAVRLHLGTGFEAVDPIGLAFADGSIWTADIHGNDVRRFDPATLELQARVPMVSPAGGPAWFASTADALWVSNQLGNGVTRIDPAANAVVDTFGTGGTCGAPVVAFSSVWQSLCDADTFLRIDPETNEVRTIPANGHDFLVLAGETLVTTSADGLATLDPDTFELQPLPYDIPNLRQLLGADAQALWALVDTGVVRVDAVSGETLATFPYVDARAVAIGDGRAWLTVGPLGAVEIDLATNQELQTIPVEGSPLVPLEASGALWVTDLDNSNLWRIEP